MSEETKEFLGFMATAFVLFFGFCALSVAIAYPIVSLTCHSQWRNSGMESSFGFMQGCLVKTEHGWIPAENYRGVQVQ